MNKALSVLLITIILFFSFSVVSFADNSIVDSGKCGETEKDNVNWVLYKTGELVISGKGNVDWYVSNNTHTKRQPWYNYFDKIWCVTVKEGITGIGANAFNVDCANVASIPLCRIDLPLSLTSIDTTTVFSSNYELSYPNNYHSKYCRYICYSGDVNKWNRVNILTTNYDYIIDTGWIIKSQSVESNYAFGVNWDMLFENEKPEPYCGSRWGWHGFGRCTTASGRKDPDSWNQPWNEGIYDFPGARRDLSASTGTASGNTDQ